MATIIELYAKATQLDKQRQQLQLQISELDVEADALATAIAELDIGDLDLMIADNDGEQVWVCEHQSFVSTQLHGVRSALLSHKDTLIHVRMQKMYSVLNAEDQIKKLKSQADTLRSQAKLMALAGI